MSHRETPLAELLQILCETHTLDCRARTASLADWLLV